MKWFFKGLFCVFAFCICICLISYSGSITESQIRFVGGNKKSTVPLQYHFVIIAQDINEAFWHSVKSGAEKAGQKYKAAIELDGPVIQNENDELNSMNIAIASNVDGIAIALY